MEHLKPRITSAPKHQYRLTLSSCIPISNGQVELSSVYVCKENKTKQAFEISWFQFNSLRSRINRAFEQVTKKTPTGCTKEWSSRNNKLTMRSMSTVWQNGQVQACYSQVGYFRTKERKRGNTAEAHHLFRKLFIWTSCNLWVSSETAAGWGWVEITKSTCFRARWSPG